MSEVLAQNEIDDLINAINSGSIDLDQVDKEGKANKKL